MTQAEAEILSSNQQALNHMKAGDLPRAQQLLKAAERQALGLLRAFGPQPPACKLLTVTLNNLACYQKKRGLLRSALRYLSQVLWLEKFYLKDAACLASTYLNLSTVLSALGKHREALRFGRQALALYTAQSAREAERQPHTSDGPSNTSLALVICFVNLATECIHLGLKSDAEAFAQQGTERSGRLLPAGHPLAERLSQLSALAQDRRKQQSAAERYPRTTLGDQNRYMRAQSAHASRLVIDPKEGIGLKLDLVRGEVCLDHRGPLTLKKPPCPADRLFLRNVVHPHRGQALPALGQPFRDMPQREKNFMLADLALNQPRLRARSAQRAARQPRRGGERAGSVAAGRQAAVHGELLFESSSGRSGRKKSLAKIEERSEELAKSRELNQKDVRLDGA